MKSNGAAGIGCCHSCAAISRSSLTKAELREVAMRELKISKNSFGTLHGSTQSRRPVATIGMSRFAADIASRAGSVLLQACFEGKSKHYSQSRVMPPASKHCGKAEMKMKRLVNILFCVLLGLVVTSSSLFAQTATGAEARLKEMNIILPPVPAPVANYVDSVRVGNLLFLAGNTAGADWKFKGKVGKDITVQEGYETARQVGLIMLAKVRAALGSLDRVKRIVKVLGMVNSPEGFGDQPRVVNGFSDLMVEVFGTEMGKHARSAVGMQALPSNSAVEVEMIVEIEK